MTSLTLAAGSSSFHESAMMVLTESAFANAHLGHRRRCASALTLVDRVNPGLHTASLAFRLLVLRPHPSLLPHMIQPPDPL